MTVHTPLLERVADKFEVADTGCFEWTASRDHLGYGRVRDSGRTFLAHRAVYELVVGPIPADRELDHICRNRACVNPDHLEAVTRTENVRRSPFTLASVNAAKTQCAQGHPYDEDNTYRWNGERRCKTCRRESERERKARRRSERRSS